MKRSPNALVLGAVLLGVLRPATASACVRAAPDPALVGYPSNEALDVPTDVVPVYDSLQALSGHLSNVTVDSVPVGRFTLRSMSGEEIGLTPRAAQTWKFELVPDKVLAPKTTYTLKASFTIQTVDDVVLTMPFTTGAGPVLSKPEPPRASLVHWQFDAPERSDCSPWRSGTCVSIPDGLPVEATYVDSFGQDAQTYLYLGPFIGNLSGVNQGTSFECLKLRVRAANATYGDTTTLCRPDGPLYTLGSSENIACTSQGLTQDGEVVTHDTNGCACNLGGRAPARSTRWPTGSLLALTLASVLRRKFAQRTSGNATQQLL